MRRLVILIAMLVISGCGVRNSRVLCPALESADWRVQGALTLLAQYPDGPICDPGHLNGTPDTPLCAAQRQLDAAHGLLRGE